MREDSDAPKSDSAREIFALNTAISSSNFLRLNARECDSDSAS